MKGRYIAIIFLIGIAIGTIVGKLVPGYLNSYLPSSMRRHIDVVPAVVVDKRPKNKWLLITFDSSQGAILATFKRRVEEINLLIGKGDMIDLAIAEYRPFMEDPDIIKVIKKGSSVSNHNLKRGQTKRKTNK